MKQLKINRLKSFFSIFSFSIVSFTSCTDDPSFVGMEILPKGDIVDAGIQEHFIKIMNVYKDPIRSDGPNESSYGIIGWYKDKYMGVTMADFVTEVSIPMGLDTFNRSVAFKPDSLVLCLAYSNNAWCGDTLQKINFRIYELNERLEPAGKYYSNRIVDYKPVLLAERMVSPKDGISDSIWNISGYENILRFNLTDPDDLLLNKMFNLTKDDLSHRDKFKNVLHGFYITCDIPGNTGALFNINLRSNNSQLKFFYTKKLQDYVDTTLVYGYEKDSCSFPINRESRMYNRYSHDNKDIINFEDENDTLIYIQGMAGSYAKIDFTDFVQIWRDSIDKKGIYNFSFSGITMEFKADSSLDGVGLYLERQNFLALYEEDEDGNFVIPTFINSSGITLYPFYSIESSGSASSYATYNASTKKFLFRMSPEYFEMLINDKDMEIKPFYLRSINSSFNFRRQILTNGSQPESKPKIIVKYVKYR